MHVIECFLECLEVLYHELEIVIQCLLFKQLLFGKTIELLLVKFDLDHSLKLANVEFISKLDQTILKYVQLFVNALLKWKELTSDQVVDVQVYFILFW